jgi:zinc protease
MATSVLGGGFFSARLLDIIRNREGLTYGIVALLGAGSYCDGAWSIRGAFAPELLDQGLNSTIRELQRFHEAGLTAGELETFKTTLTGSYKVALSTTAGLASALFDALQSGREPAWLDEYPLHLQTLTLEEVNAAVQTVLDPATMVIVKAGSLPGTENEELRGPK